MRELDAYLTFAEAAVLSSRLGFDSPAFRPLSYLPYNSYNSYIFSLLFSMNEYYA